MKLFTSQSQKHNDTESALCHATREQLSAYLDNTLSARSVWDVEKHLTACPDCAEVSRQMQATVQLLRSVERLDTGDDFMAKLHARLDVLEPEPARRSSLADWMRDSAANVRAGLSLRRVPGFGLGMAAAGIAAFAVFTHLPAPVGPDAPLTVSVPASASGVGSAVHESLQRNVALTANDPLGDVAAEYLESADSGKENDPRETGNREMNTKETNGS